MARIIGEFNKKFPVFKKFYDRHHGTIKYLRLMARYQTGILRPSWVQWLVTYACNFRCQHCEANAGTACATELTTGQICHAIDDIAKLGTKTIFFSGGESLLRNDLFEVARYVKTKGMRYDIATNCYLVEKNSSNFEQQPPHSAFTSIDGLEDSHDEFRGAKGSFKKVVSALSFFKKSGVKIITVNTFVYPGNLNQLDRLKPYIVNSGATNWRIAPAIPVGRAKDNSNMYLDTNGMKHLFEFIHTARSKFDVHITEDAGYLGCREKALRKDQFFCGAGFTRCSIMPDGEVLGCQIAYDNKYSEGNIKEKSFGEIWKKGFKRFRYPDYSNHKECLSCSHFHACRGGCWGMRLGNRHCYKAAWENYEPIS